jgi:hypothetical protein
MTLNNGLRILNDDLMALDDGLQALGVASEGCLFPQPRILNGNGYG